MNKTNMIYLKITYFLLLLFTLLLVKPLSFLMILVFFMIGFEQIYQVTLCFNNIEENPHLTLVAPQNVWPLQQFVTSSAISARCRQFPLSPCVLAPADMYVMTSQESFFITHHSGSRIHVASGCYGRKCYPQILFVL